MALIQTENLLGGVERRNSERRVALRHPSTIGTGLMGTQLDGYLALQENIHFRIAQTHAGGNQTCLEKEGMRQLAGSTDPIPITM